MIPQENYDMYHKEEGTFHMEEAVHQQTMEHTSQSIAQHCSEERSADHQPTELDHDDADRRTLDESQADEEDED